MPTTEIGNKGPRLSASGVRVAFGERTVLHGVDLELRPGTVTALVGPNGSGKSTLLRTMARVLKPAGGRVLLDGDEIHRQPTQDVARRLAYLPQHATTPAGLTVRDLVTLGRRPHLGRFATLRAVDREAIDWALAQSELTSFAERPVDALSGGERQRAWVALALAQKTELLLLDEPTTYLDVRHQLELLELVANLSREHGLTVCWVLHDLNAAVAASDAIVWLRDGRVVAAGAAEATFSRELIRDVFEIDASVVSDPRTGLPVCLTASALPAPSVPHHEVTA